MPKRLPGQLSREAQKLKRLSAFVAKKKSRSSDTAKQTAAVPKTAEEPEQHVGAPQDLDSHADLPQWITNNNQRDDPIAPAAAAAATSDRTTRTGATNNHSSTADETLSKDKVIEQLRKLGQAATLFGEGDEDRRLRLAAAEKKHNADMRGGGQQNEFLKILKSANDSATLAGDKVLLSLKDCGSTEAERILSWIARMLLEWQGELQRRSEAEKRTAAGKVTTGRYIQTRRDIDPLIDKLKLRTVNANLQRMIADIVDNCEQRQYKAAHEKYVELSIGNAAWPIGVTMVGIHERAGRSRIFTSEISHILNDESTRKCIHALKRLVSFAQRKWPADPSQMVVISTEHV